MRKYIITLNNGGVIEENALAIIVRNDCLGGNIVNFMKDNGYSSLSERDISEIIEDGKDDGGRVFLPEQPNMNTDQFIRFLKFKY